MYKEEFKNALEQYEKFWKRENIGRCILNICGSYGNPPYREHNSLHEKWLDEEFIYDRYKYRTANTYYTAEGVPSLFTNLGPGCLAACIGGNYKLAENTVWFDRTPIITDWEEPHKIKLDQSSEMWQHLVRLQTRFAKDPDVNFTITDLGGILDVVASLRGTQELLYDLYDYPDEVKRFTKEVTKLWFEAFDKQLDAVAKSGLPYNSWMNIPSSVPWYPIQCDFCAMISPNQFEEFVLPHIIEQVNYMDRSIYHLDGPGELPHLDMLLDIPGLTGIQWTAGGGQPPLWDEKWFPVYEKIQRKNKNLVLLGGISENHMQGAERLIKTLDPKGLYISAWCASPQKTDQMVDNIQRWSV